MQFFQSKFYLRPSSSRLSSLTSSNGMMCCLLYFFLLITILPYTKISLKRKNWRAFGFFLHIFVSTPSPTRTRPGTCKGYKQTQSSIYPVFIILWVPTFITHAHYLLTFKLLTGNDMGRHILVSTATLYFIYK